tara:strand:- start:2568 stop:2783 length:216 start_codon:yes stop_codon:yes gene_type:complete
LLFGTLILIILLLYGIDFDVVDIDGWCDDNMFWIPESTNISGGQREEEMKEMKETQQEAMGASIIRAREVE